MSNGKDATDSTSSTAAAASNRVFGSGTNVHAGADADMTNKIQIYIDAMDAESIGVSDVDVRTELQATVSIERVSLAIEQVSAQRSELGAYQNRLEHTINNLDNVVENTTSSESKLRDTDMADEMVRYSSYSVLMQAGQSMLAQANSSKDSVLSLFS
jgi:flagellin